MKLRKIKRDKRGFLLGEETLKIIVSVIAIIVLIYLLTTLYFNKVKADKQKKAISMIEGDNQIEQIIKSISLGQATQTCLHVPTPEGWYLFSFTGKENKPNECQGKNCLCICSNVVAVNIVDWRSERTRQSEECDESGACLIVDSPDFNLKLQNYGDDEKEIEVLDSTYVLFKKQGDTTLDFSKVDKC